MDTFTYPDFPIYRADKLPLHDLVYLRGVNNYTFLYFRDGSYHLVAKTLGLFERSLRNESYVRISKSHIVRRDYIRTCTTGLAREVLLLNGIRLQVARRRVMEV